MSFTADTSQHNQPRRHSPSPKPLFHSLLTPHAQSLNTHQTLLELSITSTSSWLASAWGSVVAVMAPRDFGLEGVLYLTQFMNHDICGKMLHSNRRLTTFVDPEWPHCLPHEPATAGCVLRYDAVSRLQHRPRT